MLDINTYVLTMRPGWCFSMCGFEWDMQAFRVRFPMTTPELDRSLNAMHCHLDHFGTAFCYFWIKWLSLHIFYWKYIYPL